MSCQTLSDTLLRDISNLYDKADDYNVKIQVGEDSKMEIFKAHSVILRARSNYFRSAFSLNWAKKEGDFYIFKKPNVTPIVFQIILKYIYTGTVALDTVNVENNFIELLLAADEMNLHELIEHLQQHIINLSRLNNDWIIQNGVKLFNIIFNRKGVFPKLEELYDEALLSIIQLESLEMKENCNLGEFNKMGKLYQNLFNIFDFFKMTPQEYYYKVRPLVLPPRKIQYKFGSSILKGTHFNLISYWIDNGQELLPNPLEDGQYEFNLLLRGSRDGFEPKDFHLKCNNKGATIVIIKLKNLDKMIGGYNPIKWNGSNRFLNSNKSFIFSFANNLQSSKIILSRVKHNDSAVSDDNDRNQGFGHGDLYIFKQSCKLVNYSTEIHDSENFEIYDYEVFQIIKK
ncbi:unnamed protein product [Rhizophagus irregularis]|nr:unnamed protein product [Rhizophagus irregularis]